MLRHWNPEQQSTKPLVKWKNLLSEQWRGRDPLLTSRPGCACISPRLLSRQFGSRTGWFDTDSPCRSPPDIRFPRCFDHRRSTLLCPCLRRPPRRASRLWNNRQQRSRKNKWKPPGRPAWAAQLNMPPKSLCHLAQGIASLQGPSASPERVFIAMLALLSCQASPTSSTSEKYWAYFPDPLTFQVVTWNSDPIRVVSWEDPILLMLKIVIPSILTILLGG